MTSMRNIGFFAIAVAWTLAACSSGPAPIKVERAGNLKVGDLITITSIVDNVSITSIKANRGNCTDVTLIYVTPPPKTLRYGDQATYIFACNVIEAEVKVDQGSWTFTWSQ